MLLDTCALIWLASGGGQLSSRALSLIAESDFLAVSSISAFEIAYLYKKGRLELPCDPEKWFRDVLEHHDIIEIALDSKLAIVAAKLTDVHKDPCDRFIIATAIVNKMPVLTRDGRFEAYGVEVIG
jgi:PIN domain nuclease of toxin-antitoxin system